MGWLVGIGFVFFVLWLWRFLGESTRRAAERQVAAMDPEGYRLAKAYEESQKPENKAKAAALLREHRLEAQHLRTGRLVPLAAASIILKAAETAYWEEPCEVYREQSLAEFGMAGRGNVSYDVGKIILTDRRVVFTGAIETSAIPLQSIVSVAQTDDSFTMSVANGKTRLLGTGNPRAGAILTRLLEATIAASVELQKSGVAPERLHLDLEMQITGAQDQVSGYLNELSDRLQAELDAREEQARWDEPTGTEAVRPEAFTSLLSQVSEQLTRIIGAVETGFAVAATMPGQTEALLAPYALLADGLLGAMVPFWEMKPPSEFPNSYREYRKMLRSMYGQLSEWPPRIRGMAARTDTSECFLKLSIEYEIAKVERALADDIAALS